MTNRFPGLISLCNIPEECKYFKPERNIISAIRPWSSKTLPTRVGSRGMHVICSKNLYAKHATIIPAFAYYFESQNKSPILPKKILA